MRLEGSVTEYLSHMQNRKLATSHIFIRTLFHKRKLTNNSINNNNNNDNNGNIERLAWKPDGSPILWSPTMITCASYNFAS